MAKVIYSEVSPVFPEIFSANHGQYWYKKAWETLNNADYTSYNNPEEEFQVYVHAATLGMLYLDFFYKFNRENNDYDDIIYAFEKIIKEKFSLETLKEIINSYYNSNKDLELDLLLDSYHDFNDYEKLDEFDYEFFELVLEHLTDEEREKIVPILNDKFKITETLVAIYCTAKELDSEIIDEDDEDEVYIKSLLTTDDYETFWNGINKNFNEIYDNFIIESEFESVYNWWENGAERVL